MFRSVEGYSFKDADARTRRSLRSIFDQYASAPILDLAIKHVYKRGDLIPVSVLVARFAVPQAQRKEFFVELLLEISKTYEDAEPVLDGLGVRFVDPGQEAVAYPGVYGDLVYVLSPKPGIALRVAGALVEAEPR